MHYSVFIIFIALYQTCNALQFHLRAYETECFFLDLAPWQETFFANFQLIDSDSAQIIMEITDPEGESVYKHTGSSGRHDHVARRHGVFRMCFMNTVSPRPLLVGFSLHADDPSQPYVANKDTSKIDDARALQRLMYELNANLDNVKDTQGYMKSREIIHRNMAENTNSRVLWWSFIEAIALVGMSYWQIVFLRRTFEVKRVI